MPCAMSYVLFPVFFWSREQITLDMLLSLRQLAQRVVSQKISSAFASELKILQIYSTTSSVHSSMRVLYAELHRASNVYARPLVKLLQSWRWRMRLPQTKGSICSHMRSNGSFPHLARLSCSENMPSCTVYLPLLLLYLFGAMLLLHHMPGLRVVGWGCIS